MLSPDDIVVHTTEDLEDPGTLDDINVLKRSHVMQQHILPEKQTDDLPSLIFDSPRPRTAKRPIQLREENKQLRARLESLRADLQQTLMERDQLKASFDREIEIIHHGYRQEIEHYHRNVQDVLQQQKELQQRYATLEERYTALAESFYETVETEIQHRLEETSSTATQPLEQVSLTDRVGDSSVRQQEEKHLIETLFLKREVQRLAEVLEQERAQLHAERQKINSFQYSIREQAEMRQKLLTDRLRTRWRIVSLLTSLGLVALLVILQFSFLAFLHVPLLMSVSLSLVAPLILCAVLAFVLATPLHLLRTIYLSAPHKKKIKKA